MKRLVLRFSLLVMAMAVLTACSKNDSEETPVPDTPTVPETPAEPDTPADPDRVVMLLPETKPIDLTDEQKALIQRNNDFSFNLFRTIEQLAKEKQSNALSPISVTYVMSMLHDGAAGQTAQEISTVLGFENNDAATINTLCQRMIEGIPQVDPTVTLTMANYIAAREDVILENQFRSDMDTYYHAETASLDFSKPEAKQIINDWCSKQTDGKIKEMVEEIDARTALIMLNAVNFKASWTQKFDPQDTKTEAFARYDGTTCELPLMHRKAEVLYQANDMYTSVYLPYGGRDAKWGMTVLLPNEGNTVDDVVNSLTATGWKTSRSGMTPAVVDIKIPRFKTDSSNELVDAIASLGAPLLFDKEKADLSKMIVNAKELCVSKMLQKAAIEVNEQGTELVAATEADVIFTASPAELNRDFHANRPFVYVVQEASSGAIFFVGTFRGE